MELLDLTRGELGTRGTAETRKEESAAASEIIGLRCKSKPWNGGWLFSKFERKSDIDY